MVKTPADFSVRRGAKHRGTIKMEIHFKNGDRATNLGQRRDVVEGFWLFFANLQNLFVAQPRFKRSGRSKNVAK